MSNQKRIHSDQEFGNRFVSGIRLSSLKSTLKRFFLPFLVFTIFVTVTLSGPPSSFSADKEQETVLAEQFMPIGEVKQATNFTITFSKDLVSDSMLNTPLSKPLISFTPHIPGKFEWMARNKLRFYPRVLLSPSTHYTAEILPSVVSSSGYVLSGQRQFQFHTPIFRVKSASLTVDSIPENDKEIKLRSTIEFNYDVYPEDALKHISIQYEDGSPISFELKNDSPTKIISFETGEVPTSQDEKKVRLKVSQGLFCIGCNLGLDRDYLKPLSLPERDVLKVESVSPERETLTRGYVRTQFNLPVNPNTAGQFIMVVPSVDYRITASHHYLDLKGNFEMGQTYQVTIRKGLRAIDGSPLKKDFSTAVAFVETDIPPQIGFIGDGYYLTRSGRLNIGLSTINIDRVDVEVEKIYENNLLYLLNLTEGLSQNYLGYSEGQALGKSLRQFDLTIRNGPNEEIVTPISIEKYLKEEHRGLFKITARERENQWRDASQWVLATDMGLLGKKAGDDLWIWVNSLTSLEPIRGAELKLISQNNQVLMTAQTNEEGVAVFKSLTQYRDKFVPYVVTASYGKDFSFLQLEKGLIAVSDFDVEGIPYLQHGYEAFVLDERGIYRPGETAHLAAIVRGPTTSVPTPFPVRLKVTGPDGKILSEHRATLNDQGAAEFTVPVPDYVKTGEYTAVLLIGEKEEIGRRSFNVEEFMPDRMKVKVSTDKDSYSPGDNMTIDVEGIMLFGPPAAGRRVQTDIEIESFLFSPPQWKSFTFTDEKRSFTKMRNDLGEETLDKEGKYRHSYTIPPVGAPPSSLRGTVVATVLEPGGRGVSNYREVTIHPYATYVGLRRPDEGYVTPNKETPIEFVVADHEGNALAGRQVEVSFYRVYWQSVLKKSESDDRYEYVSEKVEEMNRRFTVTSEAGVARFTVRPEDYGSFLVTARDVQSDGSASLSFYASGWGYSPWAMDHPSRVELDLDKQSYLPGETATVQIRAPFSGKVIVTVEREKVFSHQTFLLKENTATIKIPVTDAYKPNVYVSVHLIRSTESLERNTPVRAFGVIPLMVNTQTHQLTLDLEAPGEIRPKTSLTVRVSVKGQNRTVGDNGSGGPETVPIPHAQVVLAAVDEGICQLTDFQTPDPYGYFFGKKRLSVESNDVYGYILPEITPPSSSPSGDTSARKRHLTPVTVRRTKPVAFWSGIVKTDEQGTGSVTFQIPQFNGTVRLMAAGFMNDLFGNTEKPVLVREPIVLTPTFPRFIGSTDKFTVPVNVFNGTGSEGSFEVQLAAEGPIQLTGEPIQSVVVAKGEEKQVFFPIEARNTMGRVTFKLSARGNGEQTEMSTEIPLRPPVPFTTLAGSGSIRENNPATFKFPADWIPGTTDFSLSVSTLPAIRFAGSLQYLLQYPHGCIEQTTSKLFPLLYFDDLAQLVEPQIFHRTPVGYFIEEGITKLENMQLSSGAFAFWPGEDHINDWGSVYASHFLVEARRAGYVVSDRAYDRILQSLRTYTRSYQVDDAYSYQTAVYACYVLALAGQPEKSTMLYFKNTALDKLNEYSRAQLAGAFALSGDRSTASSLLPKTVTPSEKEEQPESGGNFNSAIRAKAIMLDVLAETDPGHPAVPVLVESLSRAASPGGQWGTTQENAYSFLALGKILEKQSNPNYTGTILLNGELLSQIEAKNDHFTDKEWAGKEVQITIQGTGTCYYHWRADGLPSNLRVDEYDHDLMVRRIYLSKNGEPLDYDSFRQGDLVIAQVTIEAPNQALKNVAIVDMLPAGFEIENPRLQSRRGIDWIGEDAYKPQYMDIRDDRMILYGDFEAGSTQKFYYGLRAVTEGTFILPPIRAEAMYAPMKASVASGGRITIKRPSGETSTEKE